MGPKPSHLQRELREVKSRLASSPERNGLMHCIPPGGWGSVHMRTRQGTCNAPGINAWGGEQGRGYKSLQTSAWQSDALEQRGSTHPLQTGLPKDLR